MLFVDAGVTGLSPKEFDLNFIRNYKQVIIVLTKPIEKKQTNNYSESLYTFTICASMIVLYYWRVEYNQ